MGVTSVTDIQNSALIKLGAERIGSENENNNRARLVKEQYPKIRDDLLRAHPWKFARTRAELVPISPKPNNFPEWLHVFQLPSDCLRIILTSLPDTAPWDTEQGKFLANETPVTIKYIQRVTNVTLFDDNFCEVLAWALACDIAYALTQSSAVKTVADASYKMKLMEARSFNAQQGSSPRVSSDDILNSRRY